MTLELCKSPGLTDIESEATVVVLARKFRCHVHIRRSFVDARSSWLGCVRNRFLRSLAISGSLTAVYVTGSDQCTPRRQRSLLGQRAHCTVRLEQAEPAPSTAGAAHPIPEPASNCDSGPKMKLLSPCSEHDSRTEMNRL